MEELDPYKDAPDLSDTGTQAAVPSLDPDYNHEASTFKDGFNLNLDRGGQEGHDFTPSQRNGQDPPSAQARSQKVILISIPRSWKCQVLGVRYTISSKEIRQHQREDLTNVLEYH